MIGYNKDNFVYLRVPKNGSTTFSTLLIKHGWKEINVYDCGLDFTQCVIWGHLTNPIKRHTKGLAEYLLQNPDIDKNNASVQQLLVSGVFDTHTYSVSMMFAPMYRYNINWIPLDAKITKWHPYPHAPEILSGNDLTNDFFQEHNLNLCVNNDDILWSRAKEQHNLRNFVEQLKETYHNQYQQLLGNVYEDDLVLYSRTLDKYHKKYSV